jgi:EF hand
MKKLILSLSVATFGFAGLAVAPAMAQDAPKEMDFVKVDADANGKVTPEEALAAGWAWTPEQFAAADRDTDGSLSADEFVTATKA